LQAMIRGTEKKALPHLLCVTNLLLHDIEDPKVTHGNSLAKTLVSYGPADRVDCVLTNPPFGGIEEDGIELNFPSKYQTRETADLFMALILRLLKPGGRAAVVLPDGFLFGEGVKTRLKEDLLAKCDLHTIVRLPNGVFAPYTDINTNLLFFTKGEPTTHVWYVEHPLPKSYKKYTKTRPIRFKEFAYLKAWWTDRKPTDFAWKVDVGDLIARDGNLDLNHPSTEEPEDTRSTEDILVDLDRSNQRVADALAQLRAALHG
ncbi:MAG: N-6 DNA methylase, partial [Bacteroidota bacterium]